MEVHAIPLPATSGSTKYIIYRPRAGLAFAGNRAMARLALLLAEQPTAPPTAANECGAALRFLQAIGFLEADPLLAELDGDFRPASTILLLTNQCQLRCSYCYAGAGNQPRKEMALELGYTAIDYACQTALETEQPWFELAFHGGGEPTYAWKALKNYTAYARQKSLPAHITLTSNGIWSAQQYAWIIANIDGLSLSVDGMPATQNKQRPFRSGRDSAAIVARTLNELDRHEIPYGIRLTATAPWVNLPEDVRFLCQKTRCQVMQIEPAFNNVRGVSGWPQATDCQAFAEAFNKGFKIALQAGRQLYYSGARPGVAVTTFCTAPYDALIVDPDGQLTSCYEIDKDTHPLAGIARIGRIQNGQVIVDETARRRLHNLLEERRVACKTCFCYRTCAGDCYSRVFHSDPGGHLVHSPRCDMNRAITRQMLIELISASDGVWRAPASSIPAPLTEVTSHQRGDGDVFTR